MSGTYAFKFAFGVTTAIIQQLKKKMYLEGNGELFWFQMLQ